MEFKASESARAKLLHALANPAACTATMAPSKRKIAFVSDATLQAGDKLEALRLPHPRGVDEVLFARRGARLLELQRKTAAFGAWFVDDGVVSETGVVLATPYDARFSLLAILNGRPADLRGKFAPLEQIVADGAERHGCRALLELLQLDLGDLGALCEKHAAYDEDMRLVRLDEARCLAWLRAKADRVAATLDAATKARPEVAAASDAAFVAASSAGAAAEGDGPSRKSRLRGCQAVCEYVDDAWAAKLASALGFALNEVFPGLPQGAAGGAAPGNENAVWHHEAEQQKLHELAFGTAAKRAKVDAAAAKAVVTTKQANLAKAAKGTKSIASFFGAKKKK